MSSKVIFDFDCKDDGCAVSPDCSGTNDTGTEDTGGTVTSGDPNTDDRKVGFR